jgi:deoxyguanosinetriphosphate triphosphohydrolase, putative
METNKIALIKLKEGHTDDIIKHLEESYNDDTKGYYNVKGSINKAIMEELPLSTEFWCLFLTYEEDSTTKTPPKFKTMYWGTFHLNDQRNMHYKILARLQSAMICENIASYVELNLEADFPDGAQISIENSSALVNQMEFICHEFYECDIREVTYGPLENEIDLSCLAQKNEYCKRQYNITDITEGRGEYQRDYDRIVHTKAFRRLVDKAQIFTSAKGDYYRTRMTHSLIVNQISKSICNQLKLNPYLTEAIALGHDLGHTPFGHQGERTLDDILSGKIKAPDNPLDQNEYDQFGGFKHNYQGLRVLSHLEESYLEGEGVDLSVQTLEGILKHTEMSKSCNLEEFLPAGLLADMYTSVPFATTLEGQIVAVADEIAQCSHDLDDAFSANLINQEYLMDALALKKAKELKERITNVHEKCHTLLRNGRRYTDMNELLHEKISSVVVDFFVQDVVTESKKKMIDYGTSLLSNNRVDKKLVWFSEPGEILCNYLKRIISKKVINGLEVSQFDSCGNAVVLGLFRAYFKNPKLLHAGTLRRIYYDMRQLGLTSLIDFETGDQKLIKDEWKKINGQKDVGLELMTEYKLKRKVLVRNICDFIAGMTDTYAISEYKDICFK